MPTVDIDNRDPGGTDDTSLVNRLDACTNTQRAINSRMLDIQSNWSQPGPPNGPTALDALIVECQRTITIANTLKGSR